MTMSMFLRLYRAPVWRCILATLVAVPFSYFVEYFAGPRLPAAMSRVMLFWYLASLLGPAVIAGSFVYSLKCNSAPRG